MGYEVFFFILQNGKFGRTQDHEIAIPDADLKADIYEIRMSFFIKQKKCVVQNISMYVHISILKQVIKQQPNI